MSFIIRVIRVRKTVVCEASLASTRWSSVPLPRIHLHILAPVGEHGLLEPVHGSDLEDGRGRQAATE